MRILKGLGSRSLVCGCLVGLYETYDSKTVAIVDAKGAGCADRAHHINSRIDFSAPLAPDAPLQPPSTIPTRNR
jgi:hypothetical protein